MTDTSSATLRDSLSWAYANLAMADKAVSDGATKYGAVHYMIRARLNKGLTSGTMAIGSILADEKIKYDAGRCCSYCGSVASLSIDHLVPRVLGGIDAGDNFVLSCRSCNSSKGGRDLLVWMNSREQFPTISVLRRYLKLAFFIAKRDKLLEMPLSEITLDMYPFAINLLPQRFPAPPTLRWMYSTEEGS